MHAILVLKLYCSDESTADCSITESHSSFVEVGVM